MPLSDFIGIWDLKIDPEQAKKLETQIIQEANDYEDSLIIRDMQAIIGEKDEKDKKDA